MIRTDELDELWGVTPDNGQNFIDQDGCISGVCLWMSHVLYSTKQEAETALKKFSQDYENLTVVKLNFSMKVTTG